MWEWEIAGWSTKKSIVVSHRNRIIFSSERNVGALIWRSLFPPDKDLSTLGAFFQLMIMVGFPTNTANKKDKRQRQLLKLLLLKSNLQLTLGLSTSNIGWCYLNIFPTSVSKALNPGDHWASHSPLAQQNVPQTLCLPAPTPLLLSLPLLGFYEQERMMGGCHGLIICFSLSLTVSLIIPLLPCQTKSYFCVVPS